MAACEQCKRPHHGRALTWGHANLLGCTAVRGWQWGVAVGSSSSCGLQSLLGIEQQQWRCQHMLSSEAIRGFTHTLAGGLDDFFGALSGADQLCETRPVRPWLACACCHGLGLALPFCRWGGHRLLHVDRSAE
jgi:hypothetical protein